MTTKSRVIPITNHAQRKAADKAFKGLKHWLARTLGRHETISQAIKVVVGTVPGEPPKWTGPTMDIPELLKRLENEAYAQEEMGKWIDGQHYDLAKRVRKAINERLLNKELPLSDAERKRLNAEERRMRKIEESY